jgi:plasmid stability protein
VREALVHAVARPRIDPNKASVATALQDRAPSTMISSCNHSRRSIFVGQVIIRNVDDRVLERLKARAAAQRKSLEQSLRDLLTEAAKPSREELLADLERIRAMTPARQPGVNYPTAEDLIREDRDTR